MSDKYDKIVPNIDNSIFELPITQDTNHYFPEFLYSVSKNLIRYYEDELCEKLTDLDNIFIECIIKAKSLSEAINKTVCLYYYGKLQEAYLCFKQGLEGISFTALHTSLNINKNEREFYRGRVDEQKRYLRKDLFHIPYEQRSKVSTNRYSVSGLPALYLSGSVYACWEELDRKNYIKCGSQDLQM